MILSVDRHVEPEQDMLHENGEASQSLILPDKAGVMSDDVEGDPPKTQNVFFENGSEDRLSFIAAQIREGFGELALFKRKGIELALFNGALLLEVKAAVGHGQLKKWIQENVQNAHYETCRRWMKIAKSATTVNDALQKWPDVNWGTKKMIDFLNEKFDPDANDEFETNDVGDVFDDDPFLDEDESNEDEGEGVANTDDPLLLTNKGDGQKPKRKKKGNGNGKGKGKGKGDTKEKGTPPATPSPEGPHDKATAIYEIVLIQVFNVTLPTTDSFEEVKRAIQTGKVSLEARSANLEWTFSNGGLFPSLSNPVSG